jgi:dolichol-phosphate mannosyltransferase
MPGPAWIVLPTYNEAANLEPLVAAVRAALPGAHVLVVDDGSPDGTGAIADRLAAAHDEVHVLHRPRKAGLGLAYVRGFAHALAAGAGYVIEMDADFSHDPADLPRLVEAAEAGADVVLGSRYVPGGGVRDWDLLRRGISRAGCRYARGVLGVGVRDLTGGFKCFRADALGAIDFETARSEGYAFQVELTYRALARGLRVREIPIVFRERERGESKMSARIALEAMWLVPALRVARRRDGLPEAPGSGEPGALPVVGPERGSTEPGSVPIQET